MLKLQRYVGAVVFPPIPKSRGPSNLGVMVALPNVYHGTRGGLREHDSVVNRIADRHVTAVGAKLDAVGLLVLVFQAKLHVGGVFGLVMLRLFVCGIFFLGSSPPVSSGLK